MARRFHDDDDFDDRPRRRRPVDDEDDGEERFSARKRPMAGSRDDDYDDDYDDRPRKKKSGSKGLIIGLSVGGGVLVLAIVGLVLFFVLRGGGSGEDMQKLLVGNWQMEGPFPLKAQFTADGTFVEDVAVMQLRYKYKVINASTIEVDAIPGGLGDMFGKFKGMPGVGDFKMPDINLKRSITVHVTQTELTLTENGISKRYRRIN